MYIKVQETHQKYTQENYTLKSFQRLTQERPRVHLNKLGENNKINHNYKEVERVENDKTRIYSLKRKKNENRKYKPLQRKRGAYI